MSCLSASRLGTPPNSRPSLHSRATARDLLDQHSAGGLEVDEEPVDGRGELLRLRRVDGPVLANPVVDRGLLAERSHDPDERRHPPVREPRPEPEGAGHGDGDEHALGPALGDDTHAATRGDGDCAGDDAGVHVLFHGSLR